MLLDKETLMNLYSTNNIDYGNRNTFEFNVVGGLCKEHSVRAM